MKITVKELTNGQLPQKEYDYAAISDRLWELGSIEDIEKKVSDEVFTLFIGINTLGIWKSDGWEGILCDNPWLLPHIPSAMEAIELPEISKALSEVLAAFPDGTDFSDDEQYFDTINFISNPRFKVNSEVFPNYSADDRTQLSKRYNSALASLDEITTPLWGYNASDNEGWGKILGYIKKHMD